MTKCICVWYWFIFLPYVSPFLKKKNVEGNKHNCVNKTSRDKGGACANEKQKRCNRIPSDITLDRNYAAWRCVLNIKQCALGLSNCYNGIFEILTFISVI